MNHDAAEIPLKRDPETGLFIWWLEDDLQHPLDLSILSHEERQRADRYRIAEKQRQFLFTRWAGRLLFSAELGIPPNDVVWSAQGVPEITVAGETAPRISVSISHTGNHTFIAIGPRNIALGIDVESVVRLEEVSGIAAAALSYPERQLVQQFSPPEQPILLTTIWTIKEAVLKSLQVDTFPDWRSIQVELGPDWQRTPLSSLHHRQNDTQGEQHSENMDAEETLESLLKRTRVVKVSHPNLIQRNLTGNLAVRVKYSPAKGARSVQLTSMPQRAGSVADFGNPNGFSKIPCIRLCQENVIIFE